MNKCYLIPTNSSFVYVGKHSLESILVKINPLLLNLDDKETKNIYNEENVIDYIVAFSDGKVLYEAETTIELKVSDKKMLDSYQVDSMEVLKFFVENEDYADYAANFLKKGKKLCDEVEKKLVKD